MYVHCSNLDPTSGETATHGLLMLGLASTAVSSWMALGWWRLVHQGKRGWEGCSRRPQHTELAPLIVKDYISVGARKALTDK